MDPFIRRLVQRLHEPEAPLSRNRHFHTFNTPEGRYALKLSRRLKALQRDILTCQREGRRARFVRLDDGDGTCRIELRLEKVKGHRLSMLKDDEFELLAELPGVRDALEEAAQAA